MNDPIQVTASALPAQTGAAVRALLIALGGYMAGKGWIDANVATAAVPVIMIVGPALWGQVTARRRHATLVTAANAAPDSVAVVK